jgi:adenosine deaminase
MAIAGGKVVKMGTLAQYVLDKRIPLECCLSSNVHTGAVKSMREHPFRLLYDEKFRVTINTDNRLMSNTTMTDEYAIAAREFSLSLSDLEKIAINSMKSAFVPYTDRIRIIYDIIKPGYEKLHKKVKK